MIKPIDSVPESDLMKVIDAAKLKGCCHSTIRAMLQRNKIDGVMRIKKDGKCGARLFIINNQRLKDLKTNHKRGIRSEDKAIILPNGIEYRQDLMGFECKKRDPDRRITESW